LSGYFFDSSALVKRYHNEPGTQKVDEIIEHPEADLVISSLAISEVTSALHRKRQERKISDELLTDLLVAFYNEVLSKFTVISLDDSLIPPSIDLILRQNLRTLDSLQLAAVLSIFELLPEGECTFVCADQKLSEVAEVEGVAILNPEETC